MKSTVQQFTHWVSGLDHSPELKPLRDVFRKQNKGGRLKESDFHILEDYYRRVAVAGPTSIASHFKSGQNDGKSRFFTSDLYYMSPTEDSIDLKKDPDGHGINPHKCPLWVANLHTDITAKTRLITSRAFPILIHGEKVETDYLRHTAEKIEYRCPDMEFSVGFGLLLAQTYEENKRKQGHAYPYGIPALVPYRDGYLTGEIVDHDLGQLSASSIDTRRDIAGSHKTIETDRNFSLSLHLSGFRLYNADLDSLIRTEFPSSPEMQAAFRLLTGDYATGSDTPWSGNPNRDIYLELQSKMQRVIDAPLWARSTHTGLYKHRGLITHAFP